MMQAPTCPHCGAEGTASKEYKRTESQQRREWWLQLEVELLDKAMGLMRFDEAEESMRRLAVKLSELLDAKKVIDPQHLDDALRASVRLARSKGAGAWIAWSLDVLHRTQRLPSPGLFALLASTPPILLEEATDALQALVADSMDRDLAAADASCLRSLVALLDDVLAFRLRRWDDTAPRPAVALMA